MARVATQTQIGQSTATNFRIVSGIAKPQDKATLGIFQGLQRAINAMLAVIRASGVTGVPSSISTDGDIGPKTLAAVQFIARQVGARAPELSAMTSNVNNLAINAGVVTNRLGQLGSFQPNTTPDPARAAPAAAPSTAIVPTSALPEPLAPPHAPDGKKGVHWAIWVGGAVLLLVGGFVIFRAVRKPKGELAGEEMDDFDGDFGYEPADNIIDV